MEVSAQTFQRGRVHKVNPPRPLASGRVDRTTDLQSFLVSKHKESKLLRILRNARSWARLAEPFVDQNSYHGLQASYGPENPPIRSKMPPGT